MYTIRRRQDGSYCIYLKDFAVVVAEFMPGYNKDAKNIKAIFEEQATTERQRDERLARLDGLVEIIHLGGRYHLEVGGFIVATEGDVCRDGINPELSGVTHWNKDAFDEVVAAIPRARSSGSGDDSE